MIKIKAKPQEKKIVSKEHNPVEFFNVYKTRIKRASFLIIVIVLGLLSLWIWQENRRARIPVILTEARSLFYNGKYEASISVYKQLPRHPIALLGVAYCYEELGNIDEARKAFSEVRDKPWIEEAVKGVERLG